MNGMEYQKMISERLLALFPEEMPIPLLQGHRLIHHPSVGI
jgi:hypothetical protein